MKRVEEIDVNSWHMFLDESGTEGYKRLLKLKLKNNWLEFQPDPDPQNANFFSLIGLLIDGKNLVNSLIPAVRKFKCDVYKDEEIVLHLSEMLAGDKQFAMYKNNPQLFNTDLNRFIGDIKDIKFRIIFVHIDKVRMLKQYVVSPAEPYELAPTIIMERAAGYICNTNASYINKTVRVWFEARTKEADKKLKKYMIDELKLPIEKLIENSKFPRYLEAVKNIRSIEWHFHGLPKDPIKLNINEYYKSNYLYEVGAGLIQGIHVADMMVFALRRFKENEVYHTIKYLEVEPIINFVLFSGKLIEEKFFPKEH